MLRFGLVRRIRPNLVRFSSDSSQPTVAELIGDVPKKSEELVDIVPDNPVEISKFFENTSLPEPTIMEPLNELSGISSIISENASIQDIANFSLDLVNTSDLSFLQQPFFEIYSFTSNYFGISPFLAIPATVVVGRLILFRCYTGMRRKTPMFGLINTKAQFQVKEHRMKIQKGEYSIEELKIAENKMQEKMNELRRAMFRNYPIFDVLPLGLFMSGNLYATWAICNAVSGSLPLLWMENILVFDPCMALVATGIQVGSIYLGADTGVKAVKDKDDIDDMNARIQRGVSKVFIVLTSITFPAQYYFGCPAFISACWMVNTLLTLSFGRICMRNQEYFKIPDVKEEMQLYRKKNLEIDAELKEFQELVKEYELREDKIEEMQAKMLKM